MGHRRKKQKPNLILLIPLVILGVGLLVIGFVKPAFLFAGSGSAQEYSVVPSTVNFPAPNLALNDLNGHEVSLADYRQKIVLVNNWAIWCPPCKSEMPTLQRYYEDHASQGFMLLGIEAGDNLSGVASFVNNYKLTFPILLDPDQKSLTAFQNGNLPNSYVINQHGTVVLAWTGPISDAMLEKYLTPLLEK
jgi:peroxiredoxin